MHICSHCGHLEPIPRESCSSCSARLETFCLSCAAPNLITANYCHACGRSLREILDPTATAAHRSHHPVAEAGPRSERKVITVLIADIVGSTALVDGLDPEDADARLAPAVSAMLNAVHLYGGTVSTLRGDGLSALFGAPTAFEDHAARACLAGVAMLKGVRAVEEGLKIRVGIHSGEVLVRSLVTDFTQTYEAIGPTVHIAARMEELATPGTVRITRAVRDLARGVIRERSLGATQVRGISELIEQYEFVAAAPTRTRWEMRAQSGLTAFVGREQEVERLIHAWHSVAHGVGRAVLLVGEPGVGKSRILHEFLDSSSRLARPICLAASASYETHSTFLAASRLMRQWFDVAEGDLADTVASHIGRRWRTGSADDFRALHSLVDDTWSDDAWHALEPANRRELMIEAAVRFIQAEAQQAPLIVAFEDLHWMDAATVELIRRLAIDIKTHRILLLCTGRPEPAVQALASLFETMVVESLNDEDAVVFLDRLLGTAPDLGQLKSALIAKTSATPLFLEEIVQSLIELEILVQGETGYRLNAAGTDIAVPATVQAVIAARLDRLPADHIDLLQKAAVVGEYGPHYLLRRLSGLAPADFLRRLELLERRGFLRSGGGPEEAFLFKHGLTRDVVYDSMLSTPRRAAHLGVVKALEELGGEGGQEPVEILARHSLSGRDWRRAATYFRMAAHKAAGLSAFKESAAYLRTVLLSLERLGSQRDVIIESIDTLLDLRRVLFAVGDLGPIQTYLGQAEALAERIDDEPRLAAASIFKSNLFSHQGELNEAIESGGKALALAHRLSDPSLVVSASIVLSLAYEFGGRSRDTVDCLAPIAATIDAEMDHPHFATSASFSVQCLSILAGAYASLGRFEEADAAARRALQIAQKLGRPYDLGLGHYYLALVLLRRGSIEEAIDVLRNGLREAVGFVIPWVSSALGYAYIVDGQPVEGRRLLDESGERARAMGLDFLETRIAAWLALASLRLGDRAAAEKLSATALSRARARSYRELEAWILRLRAAIFSGQRDAAVLAEKALEIAEALGLAPERARCLHMLGECRRAEGLPDVAILRANADQAFAATGLAVTDLETEAMVTSPGLATRS